MHATHPCKLPICMLPMHATHIDYPSMHAVTGTRRESQGVLMAAMFLTPCMLPFRACYPYAWRGWRCSRIFSQVANLHETLHPRICGSCLWLKPLNLSQGSQNVNSTHIWSTLETNHQTPKSFSTQHLTAKPFNRINPKPYKP
jgi:hypothetical protein